MKTKIAVLTLLLAVYGAASYWPSWRGPGEEQNSSAASRLGKKLTGNINGPAALDNNGLLVFSVSLEARAFCGEDARGTKLNVEEFVASLGGIMVGYRDASVVEHALLFPGPQQGPVEALLARFYVGKTLGGIAGVGRSALTKDGWWEVELKKEMYRAGAEKLLLPVTGKYHLVAKFPLGLPAPGEGDLEAQFLADSNEPFNYANSLAAANPGKVRRAVPYWRTRKPDNSYELSLYRGQ